MGVDGEGVAAVSAVNCKWFGHGGMGRLDFEFAGRFVYCALLMIWTDDGNVPYRRFQISISSQLNTKCLFSLSYILICRCPTHSFNAKA